ncbi:hypothetical protein [Treponema primitia]|uniref:hypothetical protein n=1 Tax=Treponema primitia TaxID=88058 RepID=UPI00025555B2|nr:hypothetical protein [Treponema primitia]
MTKTKPAFGILIWFFLAPFALAANPPDSTNPPDPSDPPDTNTLLDTILESASPVDPTDEDFEDEDLLMDINPEMTVYYDDRNEADYVEIRTAEKIEEYHYLSHIKYSDLIFVLSDLLRRITQDGYQWSSVPAVSYEKSEEVVLLYRKDLVNDIVYGIVQFPDFKVWLSGIRKQDAEHRFNAGSGRDMMTLVFSFASCLAQAEQELGIKQLDYTMKFFKQD